MIERVKTWINACLNESETQGTCLLAHSQKERYRLRSAEAAGLVREVIPGAYARSDYWDRLDFHQKVLHKMRALQAQHPSWIFVGPSAALVHGLAVSRRYLGRLCVGSSRKTHLRSNQTWRSVITTGVEVLDKNGLRVTSLGRTLGDCLKTMDFSASLAVADSALRLTGHEPLEMTEEMDCECRRLAGIRKARAVLMLSNGKAESGGESVARARMLELGVMVPELQRWYDDPLVVGQRYRSDFAWDVTGGSILGELDGNEKYTNPQMTGGRCVSRIIEDEHRRQSHIETRPDVLRFVRFGYSDVMNDWGFLQLLLASGVPRVFAYDDRVIAAGGILRCR